MATIHHSRMALIQGQVAAPHSRRRSPSPRRRSPPARERSPRPNRRSRSRGRHDDRAEGGRRRESERGRDYSNDGQGRGRGRDVSREKVRRDPNRRGSPQYEDYQRQAPPPPENQVPWREPQNMYPNKRDKQFHGGGGGGGADFMESRRLQRESMMASVWPPSPKAPSRGLSPRRKKPSKKSKRARSPSSSSDDSEEERRRRERKDRKRSRKEKDRENERRRRRSRSPSQSRDRGRRGDSENEDDRRHRRDTRDGPESKNHSRTGSLSRRSEEEDEDQWVVKSSLPPPPVPVQAENKAKPVVETPSYIPNANEDDSDEDVGPQPIVKFQTRKVDERSYGGQLLRGEGSAMAAFLQDGTDVRIPRRGEIGLTSDEIAQFENVGYVMSGSRHRRMNAVRIRKENQVISAEEKRGILKLQKEEKSRREAILREEFSELVKERLKGVPEGPTQ